MGEAFLYGGLS